MAISNRYIRGITAFTLALPIALLAFVILGFLIPGKVMELIWGQWANQPVGSGFILMLFSFFLGLPCFLVTTCVLTVRFNKKLRGNSSEQLVPGAL